jgi:serine/threonine protein kinase
VRPTDDWLFLDDVFALGVMAYRLVTDEYSQVADASREEECWQAGSSGLQSPRKVNPRVDEQLDAVIQRMLSLKPEKRGTARELAEAMESESEKKGPERDELKGVEWPQDDLVAVEDLGHRARRRDRDVVRVAAEADAVRRAEAEGRQAKVLAQTALCRPGQCRGRSSRMQRAGATRGRLRSTVAAGSN